MKKDKITIHNQVKAILNDFPETRNSDRLLYIYWLQLHRPGYANVSFQTVMSDITLPSFESLGRARRKVQQNNPELRARANVEAARELEEQEYREYAREVHS